MHSNIAIKPVQLREIPDAYEAVQFTGGLDNAQAILEWARKHNPKVGLFWGASAEAKVDEVDVMWVVGEANRPQTTAVTRVKVGDWLFTKAPDRGIYPLANDVVERYYTISED